MTTLALRIFDYAEAAFQKSGTTKFPTVREVANALHVSQKRVQEECDGNEGLMLTSYNVSPAPALGDHFVETLD